MSTTSSPTPATRTRTRTRRSKLTTLRSSSTQRSQQPQFRTVPIPRIDVAKVTALKFSPHSRRIAAGYVDGACLVWTAPQPGSSPSGTDKEIKAHEGSCTSVAWSPSGEQLATSGSDGAIFLWTPQLKQERVLKEHTRTVWQVVFSSSGHLLASCSGDATARIWNAETGNVLHTLSGHTGSVQFVAFDPTDAMAATCSVDSTAKTWDVLSGECLHTLLGHDEWVSRIVFSPTTKGLSATCSSDCTVRLWEGDKSWRILEDHEADVNTVHFNPSGTGLLSCGNDSTILFYDLRLGQLKYKMTGPCPMNDAVFSPDGSVIAGGDEGGNLSLWDVASGELFTSVCKHDSPVNHVVFDSSGSKVATADEKGMLLVWYLSPVEGQLLGSDKGRCTIS